MMESLALCQHTLYVWHSICNHAWMMLCVLQCCGLTVWCRFTLSAHVTRGKERHQHSTQACTSC